MREGGGEEGGGTRDEGRGTRDEGRVRRVGMNRGEYTKEAGTVLKRGTKSAHVQPFVRLNDE